MTTIYPIDHTQPSRQYIARFLSDGVMELAGDETGPPDHGEQEIGKAAIRLAVHIFVGAVLFIFLAIPAVLLDMSISILEASGSIENFTITSLILAKYTVLCADVALFVVFIVYAAWLFLKSLKGRA